MGAHGMVLAEEAHVVNALPPIDIDGGKTTDYFSLANYQHATIIIQMGVTGAASTVTVAESDDSSGSTTTDIAFASYSETTASGDTLGSRTATASTGLTTSANDNIFYVIEIDADELTDGYPWLAVSFSDPSAQTFASVCVILSGARYSDQTTQTAIA